MAKPKVDISRPEYQSKIGLLYQVLAAKSKNHNQLKNLLAALLTSSELRMLHRRWFVACLLRQGKSIREVANQAKVGTDTVVRVVRKLEKNGTLAKILKSARISSSTAKKKANEKPTTKPAHWIFGSHNG